MLTRIALSAVLAAGLAVMVGCDPLNMFGSAAPVLESESAVDGAVDNGSAESEAAAAAGNLTQADVLGRVVTIPMFPVSFFVTITQGPTVIVDHAPVAMNLLLPVPPLPVDENDAAVFPFDAQDGRTWYSLPAAPGSPHSTTNTQLRIAVRSVPDPNEYVHSVSFYVRATRTGTDRNDVKVRGATPLFDLGAGGNLALTIQGLRLFYDTPIPWVGIPYSLLDAQPPAELFPPGLARELQPVALFMRSGDMAIGRGGRFIHLAYTVPNIIDATMARPPIDGGLAVGTGDATAQVNGMLAWQNNGVVYSFANPGEWPPGPPDVTTAEFTRTIHPVAYTAPLVDANARRIYTDASVPITAAANTPGPGLANDVFELAVNVIVLAVE